jgi:hypothetical protein
MNRDVAGGLAWAIGLIALALGASAARREGLMEPEAVTRLVIGANGLMVAWLGNRMPKAFVPLACARRVLRVGGWSMVLSGLAYTAFWAFAPLPVAVVGCCAAMILGIAITCGYALALRQSGAAT